MINDQDAPPERITAVKPSDVVDPPVEWRSTEAIIHAWNCEIAKRWDGKKAVVELCDAKSALTSRAFGPVAAYSEQFCPIDKYFREVGWVVSRCRDEFTFTKPDSSKEEQNDR